MLLRQSQYYTDIYTIMTFLPGNLNNNAASLPLYYRQCTVAQAETMPLRAYWVNLVVTVGMFPFSPTPMLVTVWFHVYDFSGTDSACGLQWTAQNLVITWD